MSRKPTRGYYVKGQFVTAGSELDVQLQAERKGTQGPSRTDRKRESAALQALGEDLLGLRADLFARLPLPDALRDALAEAQRITNFEGRRRQMQYVGKLMRQLDAATIDAMRAALDEQHNGSAAENQLLHAAEQWRERLLADDAALPAWMAAHPATDTQQLRALIRQARKDAPPAGQAAKVAVSQGLAPRKGRAYRELFQLLRAQLAAHDAQPTPIAPGPENE